MLRRRARERPDNLRGMRAPEKFALWMTNNVHVDELGEYRYHPRSDAHSKQLCLLVLEDLLDACPVLLEQARRRQVVYGINARFTWESVGKTKTLDLALGLPSDEVDEGGAEPIVRASLGDVLFSCEVKSCMTEHGKSKPRLYDELSSSHEIVHQGRADAIATGLAVVNIAEEFVSPLRQRADRPVEVSYHNQPEAAAGMIKHLRGLRLRERIGEVGFEAYSTIVLDCDNRGPATLWTDPPAPQPGEADDYGTFLARASGFYEERFGEVSDAR